MGNDSGYVACLVLEGGNDERNVPNGMGKSCSEEEICVFPTKCVFPEEGIGWWRESYPRGKGAYFGNTPSQLEKIARGLKGVVCSIGSEPLDFV